MYPTVSTLLCLALSTVLVSASLLAEPQRASKASSTSKTTTRSSTKTTSTSSITTPTTRPSTTTSHILSSATSSTTPLPTTQPTTPASGAYALQGCFTDLKESRALNGKVSYDDLLTVDKCSIACSGFHLFGVEAGRECFCGNELFASSKVRLTDCWKSCGGNGFEVCGGELRMNLYRRDSAPTKTTSSAIETSTPPPGLQILKNGDFEQEIQVVLLPERPPFGVPVLGPWIYFDSNISPSTDGNILGSFSGGHTGKHAWSTSLIYVPFGYNSITTDIGQVVPVIPGSRYRLKIWSALYKGSCLLTVSLHDKVFLSTRPSSTEWTEFVSEVVLGADAPRNSMFKVGIKCDEKSKGGGYMDPTWGLLVDDVELVLLA